MKPTIDNYGGRVAQQEDGTLLGQREVSKHGGPAVDIRYPDGTTEKIHVGQN